MSSGKEISRKVLMKKLSALLLAGLAIASCSNHETATTTVEGNDTVVQTAPATETAAPMPAGTFDWSNVPVSNAAIGAFPFVTAPAGFVITGKGRSGVSENGMTEFQDFNKIIMYDGTGFFDAEGKKAKLYMDMAQEDAEWNQYKFDQSIDKYLESIGAKLVFNEKIPYDKLKALTVKDDMTVHNFIIGDPYNDPVREYALNHATAGKIMFQISSNTAQGEMSVVQLEGFEQTIKAPTASGMKSEMDKSGKAVLNINFDTDKATLQPDGQKVVDEIYALLQQNPALKISIEGHTDNTGAAARNQKLSADRANTVMYALAAKGIDIGRLKAKGYGADKPLAPNDSEEAKAKNRRVELVKI